MIDFIKKMLTKYREQIAYLFFGGCTTLISIGVSTLFFYFVFNQADGYGKICEIISEPIAITFAFFTNKFFVFRSKRLTKEETRKEVISFFIFRIIAFACSFFAMYLLVDILAFEQWICKISVSAVIIVVNYLVSKLIVFKGANQSNNTTDGDNGNA